MIMKKHICRKCLLLNEDFVSHMSLYPRHLCRRVYSFRFFVRPFVCSFVRSFVSSFLRS